MVWYECKIAVRIGIAIFELDYVPVGFETLDTTVACSVCWNNTEKDVLFHEGVQRSGVTMETPLCWRNADEAGSECMTHYYFSSST